MATLLKCHPPLSPSSPQSFFLTCHYYTFVYLFNVCLLPSIVLLLRAGTVVCFVHQAPLALSLGLAPSRCSTESG